MPLALRVLASGVLAGGLTACAPVTLHFLRNPPVAVQRETEAEAFLTGSLQGHIFDSGGTCGSRSANSVRPLISGTPVASPPPAFSPTGPVFVVNLPTTFNDDNATITVLVGHTRSGGYDANSALVQFTVGTSGNHVWTNAGGSAQVKIGADGVSGAIAATLHQLDAAGKPTPAALQIAGTFRCTEIHGN